MLTQLRIHYPQGSLVTELLAIEHGQYIVRCLVQNEGTILVTGMAAAHTVEAAEDQARNRAMTALGINTTVTPKPQVSVSNLDAISSTAKPQVSVSNLDAISSTAKPQASVSNLDAISSTPMPLSTTVETPTLPITTPSSSVEKAQPAQVAEIAKAKKTSKKLSVEANTPEVAQLKTASAVVEELSVDETFVSNDLTFSEPFSSPDVETSQEVESDTWMTQKVSSVPPEMPISSYSQPEVEPETTSAVSSTVTPIDFSDVIARTNVELKRLGWTNQQGRDYLVQTYGKRSRQLLTDDELLDFLKHLESEPSP